MIDIATENSQYLIPIHDGVKTGNFYWGEVVGTSKANAASGALSGSFMRVNGGESSTTPEYPWDETGIVVKGELTVQDETGKKVTLHAGEVFFAHRGSVLTFSADRFALVFKTSATAPMMLDPESA